MIASQPTTPNPNLGSGHADLQNDSVDQPAKLRIQARRGRPPKRAGEAAPGLTSAADKEKVTLRLSKELMDEYREWSWQERCQLGELVERALVQYRTQHFSQ